jgi:hypothetical protein
LAAEAGWTVILAVLVAPYTAFSDVFWSISFFVPVLAVFFDGSLWCGFGLGTVCQKKEFCSFPSTLKNGSQILLRICR